MSILQITSGGVVFPTTDNLISGQVIVEFRPFDFGYPHKDKYIDSVVLNLFHTLPFQKATLQYAIGEYWRDLRPGTFNWRTYGSIKTPSKPLFRRITGKYIAFRLVDEAPQEIWELVGIEFYGVILGRRA